MDKQIIELNINIYKLSFKNKFLKEEEVMKNKKIILLFSILLIIIFVVGFFLIKFVKNNK